MKYIYLVIFWGCLGLNLNAKPIDAKTAKQAAFTYYQGTDKSVSLQSVEEIILIAQWKPAR